MEKYRKKVPKPRPPQDLPRVQVTPADIYAVCGARYDDADPKDLRPEHELPVANETSAGGVIVKVEHGVPYVAVIARRNRAGHLEWCLPKGHLEGKETPAQAAVREVSEETGIFGRALRHLTTIDYWFSGRHHRVHKVVHHYLLEAISGQIGVDNDPDHEAEKAEWVAMNAVISRLAYPNERKIVQLAHDLLRGT